MLRQPLVVRVAPSSCLALVAGFVVLGCVGPGWHTPEPYTSDLAAAAVLEEHAVDFCSEAGSDRPRGRFVTDGCSSFLDGHWVECCVTHDIAYWCGGTREQRRQADADFGACVADTTSPPVGLGMRLGVRVGGHPVFPTHYRWGYGHPYRGGYRSQVPEAE